MIGSNDSSDRRTDASLPAVNRLTQIRQAWADSTRLERDYASGPATGIRSYRNVPAYGLLEHAAQAVPDRLAVIYGNERWSYRDLNADSVRCAAMLQRLGVRAGDRIGILLPNIPEYIIVANAIWRVGGVVLALSPLMVASDVASFVTKTKCQRIICLDLLANLLDDIPDSDASFSTLLVSIRKNLPAHKQLGYLFRRGYQWLRSSPSKSPRTAGWLWDEINKIDRPWIPLKIDAEQDPAYILPTGGTTGAAKAVTLSHENMVANAWQQATWNRGSFAKETMLGVLPFFHSYGMSATVMGGAAMAATLVLHHRFNTSTVINLIEKHQPSVFHAVPAMLSAMNGKLRKRSHKRLESLRWVISGGAPLDEAIAREFASHCGLENTLVVEGFGLSEASPVTHVGDLFAKPRYGCIGLPLPHTECRIVTTERTNANLMQDVDEGEIGELCIRGPQVMLGYWADPKATRLAIQDGWLRTGDLAIRHPDGYYSIVGRIKDLIITSGFNVYPSDVESILREAAGVKDAAIVGDPDDERGEIVHAHVVMKAGSEFDQHILDQHCRKYLSAHKRPRRYTLCEHDLPRNFLGKVIRRKLRESHS